MPSLTLTPEEVRSALMAAGWRCTPQRLEVYSALARSENHPTAEQVCAAVRPTLPQISLATVYKALEALVSSGLATRLPSASIDGPSRYDARGEHHYHLRCLNSGRVEDLDCPFDPDLITKLAPGLESDLRARGFHVTGYRLELVGYYRPDPE
jgi:Fe2+ or Zn2+ uptake regulation protein